MRKKKVESKEGQNLPLFLPKKATRRKDKNGRFYYLNEKGKRVKKEIWQAVKKTEKQKKQFRRVIGNKVVKFKIQNEYPNNLIFQFHWTQAVSEIKEYIFEHFYKVKIGTNYFEQLGSSDLFLFLKQAWDFLKDEYTIETEEKDLDFDPSDLFQIFINMKFINPKGILELITFEHGATGKKYNVITLFKQFKD